VTVTAWRALLLALVVHASACSSPSQRFDAEAKATGLTKEVVRGTQFEHVLYWSSGPQPLLPIPATVHVYVGGDGTPWKTLTSTASDPTPRRPIGLAMMRQDGQPSLYLGRPCYHGLATSPGCSPIWWTHRRFSEEVVASMTAALSNKLRQLGEPNLVLIGYSGGAALARLIAERIPKTSAIITIAGNLDVEAWTGLHGYSPLAGSLNPAQRAPLPMTIAQLHLWGERDDNCPPDLARRYLAQEPQAMVRLYPDFDHGCCWVERWPSLLAKSLERLGLKR
jgi:dienelactone hydrolase